MQITISLQYHSRKFPATTKKLVYATWAGRLLLSICNFGAAGVHVSEIPVYYVRDLRHFRGRCSILQSISLTLYSVGNPCLGWFYFTSKKDLDWFIPSQHEPIGTEAQSSISFQLPIYSEITHLYRVRLIRPWGWKWYVPQKRWLTFNGLHA
jgi:hypothetical protein